MRETKTEFRYNLGRVSGYDIVMNHSSRDSHITLENYYLGTELVCIWKASVYMKGSSLIFMNKHKIPLFEYKNNTLSHNYGSYNGERLMTPEEIKMFLELMK